MMGLGVGVSGGRGGCAGGGGGEEEGGTYILLLALLGKLHEEKRGRLLLIE